jgi:hypothetical protein
MKLGEVDVSRKGGDAVAVTRKASSVIQWPVMAHRSRSSAGLFISGLGGEADIGPSDDVNLDLALS